MCTRYYSGGTLSNPPLGSASVPLVLVSGPLDFRQGCTPSMLAIVVGPHGFELARPEFERSIALSPRTPVLVCTRQCWRGAPNLEIVCSPISDVPNRCHRTQLPSG